MLPILQLSRGSRPAGTGVGNGEAVAEFQDVPLGSPRGKAPGKAPPGTIARLRRENAELQARVVAIATVRATICILHKASLWRRPPVVASACR